MAKSGNVSYMFLPGAFLVKLQRASSFPMALQVRFSRIKLSNVRAAQACEWTKHAFDVKLYEAGSQTVTISELAQIAAIFRDYYSNTIKDDGAKELFRG